MLPSPMTPTRTFAMGAGISARGGVCKHGRNHPLDLTPSRPYHSVSHPMREADNIDNNIEQSQETVQPGHTLTREDVSDVHAAAAELLSRLQDVPDGDLVGEIIANALKLLRDQTNRGDIK